MSSATNWIFYAAMKMIMKMVIVLHAPWTCSLCVHESPFSMPSLLIFDWWWWVDESMTHTYCSQFISIFEVRLHSGWKKIDAPIKLSIFLHMWCSRTIFACRICGRKMPIPRNGDNISYAASECVVYWIFIRLSKWQEHKECRCRRFFRLRCTAWIRVCSQYRKDV